MATTFSVVGSEAIHKIRNSRAAATTGTEAVGVLAVDSGLSLYGVTDYVVHAKITGVATAGSLQAYLFNPLAGEWTRAPRFDVAVAANATTVSDVNPAGGLPTFARGARIAFLPTGLGPVTVVIDINGTPILNVRLPE
jgi:hypothetical protein